MTQEEKDLLLKDLCARLPYGVVVKDRNGVHKLTPTNTEFIDLFNGKCNIAPYLFPLSSMTEEQWNNGRAVNLTEFTFESFKCGGFTLASYTCENDLHNLVEFIHWLIENHFDIYGLIPMGLALDATGLNIY